MMTEIELYTRKPGRGVAAPLLRLPVVINVYTNIDDMLGSRASQF